MLIYKPPHLIKREGKLVAQIVQSGRVIRLLYEGLDFVVVVVAVYGGGPVCESALCPGVDPASLAYPPKRLRELRIRVFALEILLIEKQ
jgi:hypothetical protein